MAKTAPTWTEDYAPTALVPLVQLIPAPWNPRAIQTAEFKKLCESLQADPQFLWDRPVLANTAGIIYGGNHRYRAAQHLGWASMPARRSEIPDKLARERALRDNNQWATWVEQDLAELLVGLQMDGSDLRLLGFPDDELTRLLDSVGALGEQPIPEAAIDRAAELQAQWDTHVGDLWTIESKTVPGREHRLLCGDSTDAAAVARLMDGARAQAIISDPPFAVRDDEWDTFQTDGEFADFTARWLTAGYQHADVVACFFADKYVPLLLAVAARERIPYRRALIWRKPPGSQFAGASLDGFWFDFELVQVFGKPTFSPDSQTRMAVLEHRTVTGQGHGCEKPVPLLGDLIDGYTERGGLMADLFEGTGTTLVAAEQTGRVCYGLELDPKFTAVCLQRLTDLGLPLRRVEAGA